MTTAVGTKLFATLFCLTIWLSDGVVGGDTIKPENIAPTEIDAGVKEDLADPDWLLAALCEGADAGGSVDAQEPKGAKIVNFLLSHQKEPDGLDGFWQDGIIEHDGKISDRMISELPWAVCDSYAPLNGLCIDATMNEHRARWYCKSPPMQRLLNSVLPCDLTSIVIVDDNGIVSEVGLHKEGKAGLSIQLFRECSVGDESFFLVSLYQGRLSRAVILVRFSVVREPDKNNTMLTGMWVLRKS